MEFQEWLLFQEGFGDFKNWLGQLKQAATGTYRIIMAMWNKVPEMHNVLLQLPVAFDAVMRDPLLKDTAMNKSFLAATLQMSKDPSLEYEKILKKIKEFQHMVKQGGDEAAFAEVFWRSNIGSFVKWLWKLTYLGPILRRLPQVTVVNAWKTLQAFKNNELKVGAFAASMAALELLQYLIAGSLMTGLLGKALILLHFTTLGVAFTGGAWIAWALVSCLHKDIESEEQVAKLIAGVLKAIDPGADMGLMKKIKESTAYELYDSAVRAYPRTTRRQHSTQPIRITQMEWVPYLGLKTLFIKGLAQNPDGTKGFSEHHPMVLIRNVYYHPLRDQRDLVEIIASDNRQYFIEKLAYDGNQILVRCDCGDHRFRFAYYNHLDHSLYGRKPKKYESLGIGPPANPMQLPGMCKHLMKLFSALGHAGVIV